MRKSPPERLRSAPDRARAEQWTLVLLSQGINSWLRRDPDGWSVLVDGGDTERSTRVLALYDDETPERPKPARLTEYGPTSSGLAMAILLGAFYLVTGPRDPTVVWFQRGSASAELILGGEIWRTVTALTLHADIAHLGANAVACALFATAVCRSVGPGVGWWLIFLAGACGNALNALAHGSGHSSVGASTAIFGAVGLLAGLGLMRKRRLGLRGVRAWAPAAAGVALLAMLGTGRDTDLSAHLFGFLSGALLGLLAATPLRAVPPAGVQWLRLLGTSASIIACWRGARG